MARTINFFDGFSSSTTPTLGNIIADNIATYSDDAAYEAAVQGSPAEGNMYYNTTLDLVRYYADGSWRTMVDTDQIQTVTNKSIDGLNNTITNVDGDEVIIDAISGLTATDAQAAFAEHQVEIDANVTDISENRQAAGLVDGETDMGTYSGSTITDNSTQKVINQELETEVELKINSSEKGANNGVAELDGSGKVPASQLPTNLMEYQGDWDADTNSPTLADTDTGVQGNVYRVTVAGTTDFGAGNITFAVGDWAYNNGTTWEKSIETTLPDTDSLPQGSTNEYYTEAKVTANVSVAANTAKVSADGSIDTHSDVDTTTVAPSNDDVLTWDGSDWVPQVPTSSGYVYVSTTTTPYTSSVNEYIAMDATAGAKTVNLPAASGNAGKQIVVKKVDSSSNAVTVDGNASETIDGALTLILSSENNAVHLVCDGSNWTITSLFLDDLVEAGSGPVAYAPTLSQWGDLTSISLPPGTWRVDGRVSVVTTGITAGAIMCMGLSSTAGNTAPGSEGLDYVCATLQPTGRNSFVNYREGVVITTTSTYYLKTFYNTGVGATSIGYKISARRIK